MNSGSYRSSGIIYTKYSNKALSILVLVIFLFFLFNINADMFGGPSFVTSVRVALLFSVILSVLLLRNNYAKNLVFSLKDKLNSYGLIIVLHISVSVFISLIANAYTIDLNGFNSAITGVLQLIAYITFVGMLNYINKDYFISMWVYSTFLILGYIILSVYLEFGSLFGNGYLIRNFMHETLPQGLNRFMNGLSVLLIVPVAIFMNLFNCRKSEKFISLLTLLMSVLVIIISGSRQFLLALVVSVFLLALFSSKKPSNFLKGFLYISLALALIALLLYYFIPEDALDFFVLRNLDITSTQLAEGSDRTARYALMLDIIVSYPFFGIGSGGFYNANGFYADSGVLQFMTEQGFVQLIIHLVFVFALIQTFLKYYKSTSAISKCYFTAFIVTVLITNVLNELYLAYYMWLLIALTVAFRRQAYE